jgi:hypothetical protein
MIEEYHFGFIKILGKTYTHDVEVRWTGEVLKWWRKESHIFDVDDIKRAVSRNPEIIVLGTGAYGAAKVTKTAQKFVKEQGIELIIDKTKEAVKTFNIILEKSKKRMGQENKIIALFHLTC